MPQPPAETARSFGLRLRALRLAAGLTQEELAERAGLSANGVSALERGTRTSPYPHTVRALAAALGVDDAARDRLLALARPGPTSAEPDAPTPAPPGTTLGLPATPLLGREDDLAELSALIRDGARLVTLTGPGGVGKTRLAAELAAVLGQEPGFPDGVVAVPLAAVRDVDAVVSTLADACGVADTGETQLAAVAARIGDRRMLVVLDNLEQIPDVGIVVAELLTACPGVSVLATSRAPLSVRTEVERPILPLPLPRTRITSAEALTAAPAGRLFVERARAVVPGYRVADGDAATVAAICWRLGGLPLAIELAAPRVRLLDPEGLLSRLDQALASGGARDLPARQRTMHATLSWSYDLLDPAEQRLLALLGVFTGGFDLLAAEAVGEEAVGEGDDVLLALDGLVTHSLVVVHRAPGGPSSYSLLEPVREYALQRLREREGAEMVARRRHRAHFLALAEQAAAEYAGPDQVQWLQRTEWESANIRAAIADALADDDAETAARLCWAMWVAWWMSSHLREGRAFATEALRRPLPPTVRVRALLVVACLAYAQGDIGTALASWQEVLATATAAGDGLGEAYGTAGLGLVAMAQGRLAEARDLFLDAIPRAERHGEDWLLSLCQIWSGTTLLVEGDTLGAREFAGRGLASARRRGDRLVGYVALFTLAEAALADSETEEAERLLHEGVALSAETGDRANLAYYLDTLAVIAVDRGDPRRAAALFGGAAAMRRAAGGAVYHYYLPDEQRRAAALSAARAALGDEAFAAASDAAQGLDLGGVLDLVEATAR